MRKGRFTEARIIGMIKEQEAGMPTVEVCRRHSLYDIPRIECLVVHVAVAFVPINPDGYAEQWVWHLTRDQSAFSDLDGRFGAAFDLIDICSGRPVEPLF